VTSGDARGNPLYLEHLAEAITEGSVSDALPGTLHETVLLRLDALATRVRMLSHWSTRSLNPARELSLLERELGDWLDRLEASDVVDLATIGRYLARLRSVDLDLVVAHSVLGVPFAANRRLARAIERLAAASASALLDYLGEVARDGNEARAVYEARIAADRAERTLRLADAERLLAFAALHDLGHELTARRGDLALALGRPHDALLAYRAGAAARAAEPDLERRVARAEAVLGRVDEASRRLEAVGERDDVSPLIAYAAALDLARLRGVRAPAADDPPTPALMRRAARTTAWAQAGDPAAAREAIRSLVLAGRPAACAVELIETAALARLAALDVGSLDAAATEAAQRLGNPRVGILVTAIPDEARRTFLHWEA
jgi:hypothetical protein